MTLVGPFLTEYPAFYDDLFGGATDNMAIVKVSGSCNECGHEELFAEVFAAGGTLQVNRTMCKNCSERERNPWSFTFDSVTGGGTGNHTIYARTLSELMNKLQSAILLLHTPSQPIQFMVDIDHRSELK